MLPKIEKGFYQSTKKDQQFKDFFHYARTVNVAIKIHSFQRPDQHLHCIQSDWLNLKKLDITWYHCPFHKGWMWLLMGQVHVATRHTINDFMEVMEHWMEKMRYKILSMESQEEEMVIIGFLAKASYTLYHDDLRCIILRMPS